MSTNFAMIGGDLRIIKLAQMLAQEGNTIYVYGLDEAEELKRVKNIIFCEDLKKLAKNTDILIGPIPFSRDEKEINHPFSQKNISIQEVFPIFRGKTLIAGSIPSSLEKLATKEQIQCIDLMKQEELAILNAISTAEGAIEIAMANTNRILQGSHSLILGFGRIAKILAKKLEGLSSIVTCSARKEEDLAWIQAYGYQSIHSYQLGENLSQYDLIINTIPHRILTRERTILCEKRMLIN